MDRSCMIFKEMMAFMGWHRSTGQALEGVQQAQGARAQVRTRIDPIVARIGRWLDVTGTGTRMVLCRIRAEVDTAGEEPRWPMVEIQALTSLPRSGHGPAAVNPVYVRL
jgi:hypothetical protein